MCSCTQEVKDYGVVTKVELKDTKFNSDGYRTKYRITVDRFNAVWQTKAYVYTNELYVIGDTIQITKKTN